MANKAMYNVKSAMSGDPRYNSKLLTEIQNEISKYAKNLKISGIDVLSYTRDGNGTYSYKFRVNTKSVDSSYQNGLSNLKGQATLDSNGNLVSSVKISSDGITSYDSSRSKPKKYLDPNIKPYDKIAHINYGNEYKDYKSERSGKKIKHSELYHHGILGQKWGIRRFQNEDGSLTEAGKKRYDVDVSRQTGKIQRESISKLSDKELIDRLNRVRNEKQYAELTEELYRPGRKRAKNLGSQALERLVKQPMMNAAGNFIEKTLNKSLNVLASSLVGVNKVGSANDFIKMILS